MTTSPPRLLEVTDLSVQFPTGHGLVRAVDGVSLYVDEGEIVGLVGESGCGKSVLVRSLLRLVPEPGKITGGRIEFASKDVLAMDGEQLRQLRGAQLSLTPQDAMSALNPLTGVLRQVTEAITAHTSQTERAAEAAALESMIAVNVPDAVQRAHDFPHQFSGGMRQRLLLAMGMVNHPRLLLADEPTTALDVIAQSKLLALLAELNRQRGTALLLVSHNLNVIASLCQRIVVMYAGRIVEEGPVEQILSRPEHPYTAYLLRSLTVIRPQPRERLGILQGFPPDMASLPSGCKFHPRCPLKEDRCMETEPPLEKVAEQQRTRCWVLMRSIGAGPEGEVKDAGLSTSALRPTFGELTVTLRLERVTKCFLTEDGDTTIRAVRDLSLTVRRGEALGLIGESGCGKSTLARLIAGLLPVSSGQILFEDDDIAGLQRGRLRDLRRKMQIIFQDPLASLDSRMRVRQLVREPLNNLGILPRSKRAGRAMDMLDLVGLGPALAERYPHQLSGGQRQRVSIARALVVEPTLLICDEPTSALDVPVQAQILSLISTLREMFGLTCLFISHDLDVVRSVVERVAVMYMGRIIELADADDVYRYPFHPYTAALLDAADPSGQRRPQRDVTVLRDEATSALNIPSGCCLHPRCPMAQAPGICSELEPNLSLHREGRRSVACHLAEHRFS